MKDAIHFVSRARSSLLPANFIICFFPFRSDSFIKYAPILSAGNFATTPVSATDQGIATAESIYVNPVTAAGTVGNGSNLQLYPGQQWTSPGPLTGDVSVMAATNGHKFTIWTW